MADNVALSSSTSATIASDDIGGVQYQRVKIAHGADGSATDASSASPLPVTLGSASVPVTIAAAVEIANDAGNPLPVSASSLPLPSGAATAAKQPALGTVGTPSADVLTVQGATSMTPLKVDGSATTQPVSAASLPLPSGASTAAKQPALGTAGTASSDVLTVQGIASMTALKVDGSGVTQPVSGTVTVNALPTGTNTVGNVGLIPRTSGGCSASKTISAATTNATSVKASAGQVFGIVASNVNAAARYLKLYDKASAPTVGTDVPVLTLILPGATTGGGIVLNFPVGVAFANGIAFAVTSGAADSDTGAISASESIINVLYA
jgi:hypothetical protein